MRNYIKYLLLAGLVAFYMIPGYAFSSDNLSLSQQPNGFRGIYWDSDRKNHLYLFSMFDKVEGVETFNRECDLLTFGAARLGEIRYQFYNDRFYQVSLILDNDLDYKALLDELTNAFGTPEKESDVYMWGNDTVTIQLFPGGASISYLPILNEMSQKKDNS